MDQITRRKFLQIAGGITFLSLVPAGKGLFAASDDATPLPLFTVIPYIQPGPASTLVDGQDTLVVSWQTENLPASFQVLYGQGRKLDQNAAIVIGQRTSEALPKVIPAELAQEAADNATVPQRLNYSATLSGLKLGQKYRYQVIGNGQLIAEGYATTRKPRGTAVRFAAFGDNSFGDLSDKAIAYYAYLSNPDFIMNTGDNVYESGLDNEYTRYFFPVYNADVADLREGAPLLRSVPFYTVIANHDVPGSPLKAKKADPGAAAPAGLAIPPTCADFGHFPDSLGYYTAMHLPANGPKLLTSPTPIIGDDDYVIAEFKKCAGDRFPTQANYSFDYGDLHFLCLDSNDYVDPTDSALQTWIESDLAGADALWKFVVYHHPGFNVGGEHYKEQHMRVLSPLFEKHGVDIVLHGHEHTYQRTQPLKFAPTDISKASDTSSKDRRIPGTFTIDRKFDGISNTVPDGVIYLVTGAGGKELYEPDYTDAPDRWLHADDNNIAYVSKFYSREHSLTLFEVDGKTMKWTQKTETGMIIDEVTVTKA